MTYLSMLVYGLIQGLTEFLPVSSSGHLAILPYIMELKNPGVLFDLMMHVGTALAVGIYFHHDLKLLSLNFFRLILKKEIVPVQRAFLLNFVVTTLASVVVILICKDFATLWRSPDVVAFNLFFFGLLMAWADRSPLIKTKEAPSLRLQQNWRQSIIVGIAQAIAIFPGVSRSGITMTAMRAMGIKKEEAGAYSFLLSFPLIMASALYSLPKIATDTEGVALEFLLGGIVVSFVIGFLTIHYFLKLIKYLPLSVFTMYRIALALAIVLLY